MEANAFGTQHVVVRPDHNVIRLAAGMVMGIAFCSAAMVVIAFVYYGAWWALAYIPFVVAPLWLAYRMWQVRVVLDPDGLTAHNPVRSTRLSRADAGAVHVLLPSDETGKYLSVRIDRRDGERLSLLGLSSKPGPDGKLRPERRAEIQQLAAALGVEVASWN